MVVKADMLVVLGMVVVVIMGLTMVMVMVGVGDSTWGQVVKAISNNSCKMPIKFTLGILTT